jgi:hypothetical protein
MYCNIYHNQAPQNFKKLNFSEKSEKNIENQKN